MLLGYCYRLYIYILLMNIIITYTTVNIDVEHDQSEYRLLSSRNDDVDDDPSMSK